MKTTSPEELSLSRSDFQFEGQQNVYHGKVRDVYTVRDKVVMIASDRISAFDHILPRPIPFKGQILNGIAAHFLKATSDIVPNWLEALPHPNAAVGKLCDPIKLEMVIRGYLTGHAWRLYKSGERHICGVQMPDGMKEHDRFPVPIITPATKADEGHDEDISEAQILERNIVDVSTWNTLCRYTRELFQRGSEMAYERGLILVDTKYEFGIFEGEVVLIDEIHTPDSSRYFYLDGYEEKQRSGDAQEQLSKEFVREWLMANGFQGKEGDVMPKMPTDFVWEVSERYRELYELVIGKPFEAVMDKGLKSSIEQSVNDYFKV